MSSSVADVMLKLHKLLRSRGRNAHDADDLIQEAFLRLQIYRREHAVREPEAFLVRTIQNLTIDVLRQRARRIHVAVDGEDSRLVDPRPPLDEVLAGQQCLQRLRQGLAALAPRTREAILLHRIDHCTHAQIAAHLGISISAVEKHIVRAAGFLSDWMAEDQR